MKIYLGFLFYLALFVPNILSKLTIYSPDELKLQMPNQIQYSIANFGHIPYGKTIVGKLLISQSNNLCEPDPIINEDQKYNNNNPLFILAERGQCKFTKKVINGQQSGASMVIITDNFIQSTGIVMANDGHGLQVQIPSIFITKQNGDKLRQILANVKKDLILKITFDTNRSDKVLLNFWLDISNRHSYIFLRDFYNYYVKIESYVQLNLYYKVISDCTYCEKKNCISSYCLNPHKNDIITGYQYLQESLKQYYIFEINREKYWKYTNLYDEQCSFLRQHKDCSNNLLQTLGFNITQIQIKVNKQIQRIGKQPNNNIFANWTTSSYLSNILFYPDISINNLNYRGQLIASDIFELLCNSLNNPPESCEGFTQITIRNHSQLKIWPIILGIIIFSIFIFLISILIYKRVIKKSYQNQMKIQVNQMVTQYMAFHDIKQNVSSEPNLK